MNSSADTARPIEADVLVVGAGPAGMTMTLLLAQQGLRTICIDRVRPVTDPSRDDADLRTTALLVPAVQTLETIGVWERASRRATPLRQMRLVEADRGADRARQNVVFEASELDRPAFGSNIAVTDLKAAQLEAIAAAPNAELIAPTELSHVLLREDAAFARLGDGRRIRARLVVAADGRDSQVRAAAGIRARRWAHGARATVFTVTHVQPHAGVSVEIHRTGGPFTLVPHVDDAAGRAQSSVVWMESDAEAQRLAAMDDSAFEREANARSLGVFGPLTLASRRMSWPVISMVADRLVGRRTALIAETAHVAPPVGAQGLNMSMADTAALATATANALERGADIGGAATLAAYETARLNDIRARIGATAALTIAADGLIQPVRAARALGLATLGAITPARRAAMRFGLGS